MTTQPTGTPTPPTTTSYSPMQEKALAALYLQKRVNEQKTFYKKGIAESVRNSRFLSNLAIALVLIAGVLGGLNALLDVPNNIVAGFAVILPIIGGVLTAFEKLYGWEQRRILYKVASDRLEENELILTGENTDKVDDTYSANFTEFITAVEDTLKSEMEQWGKPVLEDKRNYESNSPEQEFKIALSNLKNFDEEKQKQILAIIDGTGGQPPTPPTNG